MISEYRKKLYNLEYDYIEKILTEGVESTDLQQEMSLVLCAICDGYEKKSIDSILALLRLIKPIDFSSSFLSSVFKNFQTNDLSNDVSEYEISHAKNYVEQLLGVDLSQVKVIYLDKNIGNDREGFCITCGDSEHHVFYQDCLGGVISTDLIVHELGHAAEHIISRNEGDDLLLNKHISLSEAIAYYCQFSYLLRYGTKAQRVGSWGALFYTYLAIITLRICVKNKISLSDIDENEVVNKGAYKNIIDSYEVDNKDFVIKKIGELKEKYSDISELIGYEISPRFGLILGLFLLNKSQDAIRSIIGNNTIDHDLEAIVSDIVSNDELSILNLEASFNQYFGE